MDAPTTGSNAATAATGRTVGNRYTLGETVGSGGMGTVWRAHDELLRRDVAVKEVLLPPGLPAGERQVLCERTLREARAAAALNHPAVVRVYDVVQDGERPWIVMELLEARNISEVLRDDGPMSVRKVAEIGLAVLGALEAAHRVGVLHRDVKPGNVLIGTDGRTTLTDFGVARSANETSLTSTGLLLGSPQYIAPERARGQKFGPSSDLWSLGATLYTAVEGRPPFDRGDPLPTMTAVVCEPPDEYAFAGPLELILDGLLEKDPAARWDAARTRAALKDVLSSGAMRPALPAPPPSPAARSVSTARRALTSRLANAVATRSPTRAMEGTAAMEAPSFTGTQHGLPITGESALSAGRRPSVDMRKPPPPPTAAPRPASAPPQRPARSPATHRAGPTPRANHAPPAAPQVIGGRPRPAGLTDGTPRRALYLQSDEAMRASAAGHTSGIPRSRFTQKQQWMLFAAAGLAVVLVAFGGAYAIAQSVGGPESPNTWTSIGQGQQPAGPKLVSHTGKGYSVSVPAGWTPKWQDSARTNVKFFEDGSEAVFIQFRTVSAGRNSQQKMWEIDERGQKKNSSGYERLSFASAKMGELDALDWEWRWTPRDGQRRHILDRGVVVGGVSYQIHFSVPEDRYEAGLATLNQVSKSFRTTN